MYVRQNLGAINFVAQAAAEIVTHVLTGALQRKAHARAKKQAWEQALQRIPEDDYVDYAQYVKDHDDLYKAWETGSWLTGHGATLPEFGLIHIRENGPRTNKPIKALKPGPRPDPGPRNKFSDNWPASVLHRMPPLSPIVPRVPGINAPNASNARSASNAQTALQIPAFVFVIGAGVALALLAAR